MRAMRRGAAVILVMAAISVLPTGQAYPHTTLFVLNGGEQLTSGYSFTVSWLEGPVAAGVGVTTGVNDQYDLNGDQ